MKEDGDYKIKECKAVDTKITNCAEYKEDKTCDVCDKDFVQNDDNTKCEAGTWPTNCERSTAKDECNSCTPPYYVKEKKCQECSIKNASYCSLSDDKEQVHGCTKGFANNKEKTKCDACADNTTYCGYDGGKDKVVAYGCASG